MDRFITVSGPCDGRCGFCDRGPGGVLDRVRPPTDPGALLAAVDAARAADRITFGGDEPLTHAGILDAIRRAKAGGTGEVDVMTSGVRLPDLARSLAAAGLRSVVVPLYGPDAPSHDAVVGAEAFDRALAGIASARAAGIAVRVQMLALRANLGRIREIDSLVRARTGAGLEQAGHVLPRGPDPAQYASVAPRYSDVIRALGGSDIPLGRFPLCVAKQSLPGARGGTPGSNAADLRAFPAPCAGCALRPSCPGVPVAMLALGAAEDLRPELAPVLR